MSALLETIATRAKLTNLVKLNFVYPLGELPPGDGWYIPDGEPIGQMTDTVPSFQVEPPQVGDTVENDGAVWTIQHVEHYDRLFTATSDPTAQVWDTWLTKDGSKPVIEQPSHPDIPYVIVDAETGELALNEWGNPWQGCLNGEILHRLQFQNQHKVTHFTRFQSVDAGYPEFRIYWC